VPYYRSVGEVPRKRHVQFRQPDGRLYAEELMGEEGFSSDSALLYHRELPTRIVDARPAGSSEVELAAPEVLLPRHLLTHKLPTGDDLVTGRTVLMGNSSVRLSYAAATGDSGLYRDSDGDLLVYVESGRGRLESVFGPLEVGPGDYVVVPTGTTHRWVVTEGPLRALVVEARGHVTIPKQYLGKHGQVLEASPYCERDLRMPSEPLLVDGGETEVLVRRRGRLTTYTYASHPFDVVGWDGCLYPYALSIHDFEPVTGRLHQPPPVHQTFSGPGFVVCSFVPRLLDYHPEAVPVPYNHANVDSDEVLFYCGGDFTSRAGSGIGQGSISLHPGGFTHGPQPGSVERALGKAATDELAVMVDTFAPLDLAPAAYEVEDPGYPWTWAR
jgi:homogentisate 1,2-dioxygenase